MNKGTLPLALAAAVSVTLASNTQVHAATFRVMTKVYQGADLNAFAEHLILFDEGLAYDLPQIATRFVTVFDAAQERVTLLDRETKQQTTVTVDELVQITAQARAAAMAGSPQQQARIGLSAKVQPSGRVIGYMIRFGNFEYHTTTRSPEDSSIAADYGRFVDLASRLNLVRRLGPPPFARMTLNQHIASKGEVPLETMRMHRHGESLTKCRSTHALEDLSAADRERINEVQGMLTVYRWVNFSEFPK